MSQKTASRHLFISIQNEYNTMKPFQYQGNEYKGFPHREVGEMHFEPFIACNKKVPSTSAQKKIVVILTIGDDICEVGML